MPAPRLPMRKIREVLRLKHEQGLTHRAVAQACAIRTGTGRLLGQRRRSGLRRLPVDHRFQFLAGLERRSRSASTPRNRWTTSSSESPPHRALTS